MKNLAPEPSRKPRAAPTVPVGILGGMGPAAGADFARLFVQSCTTVMVERGLTVSDQSFPEHWLAQVPVLDRTAALVQGGDALREPLEAMLTALGRLESIGARTVAIACNTAHAWHPEMQSHYPRLRLLHVGVEVANHLRSRGITSAGLLATEGTYRSGVYDALSDAGIVCHTPSAADCGVLMRGIYEGVKAGNMALARSLFTAVAASMMSTFEVEALVLGCTEIPLAFHELPEHLEVLLVNPAEILARSLAECAYPSRSPVMT